MINAMVLCAGFGTRLRPITDELPKPLVPVGDRPALAHVVGALRAGGVERVVVNTHYRASYFSGFEPRVDVIHEESILGTAGGIAHAASMLGTGDVVIWNGDILAPALDLAALLESYRGCGCESLWVVEPLGVGQGTVGLNEQGRVVRLRGERFGHETSGGNYLGIQVMGGSLRRTLPAEGCLVGDVALPLLRRGGELASYTFTGAWDDIGEPAALLRANLRWLAQSGLSFWCAPDAVVDAGVQLHDSVVGAKCKVSGTGVVRETVVFPGATLVAPSDRELVATATRVAVGSPSL